MPEEREVKIPVSVEFALPDLGGVVDGVRAVDRGSVELSATYWDTDDLTLLRAMLGTAVSQRARGGWSMDAQSRSHAARTRGHPRGD